MIRRLTLIAKTILIEAIRRREIYGIVLLTVILIGWSSTFRFFDLPGLHQFYQEMSLKVMSVATIITVIVLAAIQLPREFESRTIYTVLAKPISRLEFVLGKFLGVIVAGIFCLSLFMLVFLICNTVMGYELSLPKFFQYIYLQALLIILISSLSFALSLIFNQDAAISLTALIYLLGQVFTSTITIIYETSSPAFQIFLKFINYTIPQPALYDMSAKVVHAMWGPIPAKIVFMLTAYTFGFATFYLAISYLFFRRKPL